MSLELCLSPFSLRGGPCCAVNEDPPGKGDLGNPLPFAVFGVGGKYAYGDAGGCAASEGDAAVGYAGVGAWLELAIGEAGPNAGELMPRPNPDAVRLPGTPRCGLAAVTPFVTWGGSGLLTKGDPGLENPPETGVPA